MAAGDWLDNEPPQIGDKVIVGKELSLANDIPYKNLVVSYVNQLVGDTWDMTAKEVEE